MKKLLVLFLALFASIASAQIPDRYDMPALTTIPAQVPPGSLPPLLAVPNATVSVCGYPAVLSQGMCTNTITTYTDSTLTTACPSTAQLTVAGTNVCVSTTGLQGSLGFWFNASQQHVTYTIKTYYGTFGPFDITQGATGPAGAAGSPVGVNVVTNGADPTGITDSSSAFASTCSGNPNGTAFVPQGTYLLAATADLTLPYNCPVFFANGAQMKTGNQGTANISTIQRIQAHTGSYTVNLSGCTASSIGGTTLTETFTSCPNTFPANELVILTGLTHVANCYRGCNVTGTPTGTSFVVQNSAATTISAGSETGSAITTYGDMFLSLATLGATSSSTASPGIITINVTNTLPALPNIIHLAGTTNVPANSTFGAYVVIPSSVTGTSFQLACPTGCVNKSTASETGTANYQTGGFTFLQLASPLPGIGTFGTGVSFPYGGATAGFTQIVCTGTSGNYARPYWISAIADSQNMALLDPRGSAAQETVGSCYLPHHVTFQGGVQAAQTTQIVQHGSSVFFQGSNDIYVGWYGAQGYTLSSDDSQSFQEALFWNAGKHIVAPHITPAGYGASFLGSLDYTIAHAIDMYGNAEFFDGQIGTQWTQGTVLNCTMTAEPCVIMAQNVQSSHIENFSLYSSQACASANNILVSTYPNRIDNDGLLSTGGEPWIENLFTRCFKRDGLHIVSGSGGGENTLILTGGQPDYWRVEGYSSDANGAYGMSCWGTDCNNGLMKWGNASSNPYGGFYTAAQIGGTYINAQGAGNSFKFNAGSTNTVVSDTVSGSGYNAQCVVAFSSLPTNYAINRWIDVAGTVGSGGAAGTDGTWQITNVAGSSVTYTCPGASGGPASTGTSNTSSSDKVYAAIQAFPNGNFQNNWQVVGLSGGSVNGVFINAYNEGTNGCFNGNGWYIGGDAQEFISTLCTSPYVNFTGSGIFPETSGSQFVGANVDIVDPISNDQTAFTINSGVNPSFSGANYTGHLYINFNTGGALPDWRISENPSAIFEINNQLNTSIPFEIDPVITNITTLNPPKGTSGNVAINTAFGNTGMVSIGSLAGTSNGPHQLFNTKDLTVGIELNTSVTAATHSGCSIATFLGAAAGKFTSGTTGTCTVVITPGFTATDGFSCWSNDRTTPADHLTVTSDSATTVTLSGTTVSGDVIDYGCIAF